MSVISEYDDADVELGATSDSNNSRGREGSENGSISTVPDATTSEGAIPNSPLHISTQPDSNGEDEEVVRSVTSVASPWPVALNTTSFLIAFSLLMTIPAAFIWISHEFMFYNIFTVKASNATTNYPMESIRYIFILWAMYAQFVFVEFILAIIPYGIRIFFAIFGLKQSKSLLRLLFYFKKSSSWFRWPVWILSIAFLGGLLVYPTTFFVRISSSLFSKAPAKSAVELATVSAVKTRFFYVERFILNFVVFLMLMGAAEYLKDFVGLLYDKNVLNGRVQNLNYRFHVINGIFNIVRWPSRPCHHIPRVRIKQNDGVEYQLAKDKSGDFSSEGRVLEVFRIVWEGLDKRGVGFLTKGEFEPYFEAEDFDEAFSCLNPDSSERVERGEFRRILIEMYRERHAVEQSILNNVRVIGKLHDVLIFVACFLTFTFGVPIFELNGSAIFVIFGLLWTGMGFLFNNTFKTCFESLVFVFIQHVYDVGDRVLVDNDLLTVEKIEIFTTVFRKWDGMLVYIPNSSLCGKNIGNLRRSGNQSEFIDLLFPGETPTANIWELRQKILEYVKEESKGFTGVADIISYEDDGGKARITLMLQYRGNFHNHAEKMQRKVKFMAAIRDLCTEIGLVRL